MNRNYGSIAACIDSSGDRIARMSSTVDQLWDVLHPTGVSWVGFYLHAGGRELILGPRRDKPACSPIGLHGACGMAFLSRQPLIVRDVRELGPNYIACDPRDQSEIVIPLLDVNRVCWGVLDMDSHDIGSFDESDVVGLNAVLEAAKLTVTNVDRASD